MTPPILDGPSLMTSKTHWTTTTTWTTNEDAGERQNDVLPSAMPWLAAFPIAFDVILAIGYALVADWRRCIYWAAAAVLTVCITI